MNANFTGIHSPEELKVILESESAVTINEYLALQEESETPRIYLTWSLIALVAGLLGRNASLILGPNLTIRPNLFVILLGQSRLRKSTAINMTHKLFESMTLNLAPTDTGAQRHGIMSAMSGLNRVLGPKTHYPSSGPLNVSMIHPRRSDDMMIVAPELGRLLGLGSVDMMNFMNDLYDGALIDYQTKAGETRLTSALASLLGATTPQNLAGILPESATGHGILGRTIFIYADAIHKPVPLPPEASEEWYESRQKIVDKLRWIDQNRMNFMLSDGARKAYLYLYDYIPMVEDPRLENYTAGRKDMLMKVAMCVAAMRTDTALLESDVLLAHELLHAAEPKMHKALEFFGRNKAFAGRMAILQFLRGRPDGSSNRAELVAAAASELSPNETNDAIQNMIASGELIVLGDRYILGELKNQLKGGDRNKLKRTQTI